MMEDEQRSPEFQQHDTSATTANITDSNNNNNNNEIVSKIVKQPGWRKRSSLIQVAAGQQLAPSTLSAASSDKDHNNNNNLNNLNNNNNNNQNDNNLNNNLNNNNNNNKSDDGSVAPSGVANSSGGGGTDASKSNSNNQSTSTTNNNKHHHHHNNVNPFNIKNLFASTLAPSSSPPQLQPQSQPPSTSLQNNSDSLTSNNHSKDGPEHFKSAISSESSTGEPVPVLDLEQNNLLDRVKSDTSVSSNGPLKDFILQQPSHIKHNPRIHFKIDDALAKQALEISNKFAEMSVREPSLTSLNSARLIPTVYHSENNKLYFKSKSTLKNCPLDRVGGFRLNSNLNIKVFERSKSADDELSSELSHGARSPDETENVGTRMHSSVDSVKLRKSQTSLRSVKSGAKSKTKYKIKLKTKSNCHSIRIVPQKQSPPSTLQQEADCHNSTNNNNNNNNSDCDSDRKRASSPKSGPSSNSNSANVAAAATSPNSSSSPLSFSSLMDKFGFNNANNKSK